MTHHKRVLKIINSIDFAHRPSTGVVKIKELGQMHHFHGDTPWSTINAAYSTLHKQGLIARSKVNQPTNHYYYTSLANKHLLDNSVKSNYTPIPVIIDGWTYIVDKTVPRISNV